MTTAIVRQNEAHFPVVNNMTSKADEAIFWRSNLCSISSIDRRIEAIIPSQQVVCQVIMGMMNYRHITRPHEAEKMMMHGGQTVFGPQETVDFESLDILF